MAADHKAGMATLKAQYQDSVKQHDSSLDQFARAMSELASASKAQVGVIPIVPIAATAAAPAASSSAAVAVADALVSYDVADQVKCTNCKTCYQDLPELFEKTRIVIDGESREVAQLIPGVLERVTATPELKARIKRVSANCDAEIIR